MAFKIADQVFNPFAQFGMAGQAIPIGYWAVTGLSFRDEPQPRAHVRTVDGKNMRPIPYTNPLLAWLAVVHVDVAAWLTKADRTAGRLPVRKGSCEILGAAAADAIARLKAGENAVGLGYDLFAAAVAEAEAGPLIEFKGMERVD